MASAMLMIFELIVRYTFSRINNHDSATIHEKWNAALAAGFMVGGVLLFSGVKGDLYLYVSYQEELQIFSGFFI